MYKLYRWYPWEFGRWIEESSSQSIDELLALVKGKPSMTYKIEIDGTIVKARLGKSWRYGMVIPKLKEVF